MSVGHGENAERDEAAATNRQQPAPGDAQQGGGVSTSLLFVAIGVVVLLGLRDTRRTGATSPLDPGPRAFPMALAALLMAGGVWELVAWIRVARVRGRDAGFGIRNESTLSATPSILSGVLVAAGVALFIWLLPHVGFAVSAGALVLGLALYLGTRPLAAMLAAVVLVSLVHLLFGLLFEVALPVGDWWS